MRFTEIWEEILPDRDVISRQNMEFAVQHFKDYEKRERKWWKGGVIGSKYTRAMGGGNIVTLLEDSQASPARSSGKCSMR